MGLRELKGPIRVIILVVYNIVLCICIFSINSLSILYNVVHAPRGNQLILSVCVGVMYSGEYDVCDVTLSVYPHRAS